MVVRSLGYLTVPELGRAAAVDREWGSGANTDELWRQLSLLYCPCSTGYVRGGRPPPNLGSEGTTSTNNSTDGATAEPTITTWKEYVRVSLLEHVTMHQWRPEAQDPEPPGMSHHFFKKLLFIGDSDSGKTNIILNLAAAPDATFYAETLAVRLGIDFKLMRCLYRRKVIKLQMWDTAGQERFRTMTTAYYRGADGIFLVFNMASKSSLHNCESWIKQIRANTRELPVVLVGNTDGVIGTTSRQIDDDGGGGTPVTSEEARAMAVRWRVEYAEVSTNDHASVHNAASLLIRKIVRVPRPCESTSAQAPASRPARVADGCDGCGGASTRGCVVC